MSEFEVPDTEQSYIRELEGTLDEEPGCWTDLLEFLNEHYRPDDTHAARSEFTESSLNWTIEREIIELRMPNGRDYVGCIAYTPTHYVVNDGDAVSRLNVMEVTLLCVNRLLRGTDWAKRLILGVRKECARRNIKHAIFNGPKVGELLFPHARMMALSLRETPVELNSSLLRFYSAEVGGVWGIRFSKESSIGRKKDREFFARVLAMDDLEDLEQEFIIRSELSPGFRRVFTQAELKERFIRQTVSAWIIVDLDNDSKICGFISFYHKTVLAGDGALAGTPEQVARLYYSIPILMAKPETILLFVLLARQCGADAVVAPSTGWHTGPMLEKLGFWPSRTHDVRGEFLTPIPPGSIGVMRGFESHTL